MMYTSMSGLEFWNYPKAKRWKASSITFKNNNVNEEKSCFSFAIYIFSQHKYEMELTAKRSNAWHRKNRISKWKIYFILLTIYKYQSFVNIAEYLFSILSTRVMSYQSPIQTI